ncbi:hypothetical protein [Bradyrhizobium sp.]|uniref:hypothetical protein n=1 Tax=Bradyrhizobium sp. TaxID=376 RepID=UPI0039E6BC9A
MPSTFRAAAVALLMATGQAFAAGGECLLEVNGHVYIDGVCDIRLEGGGSFTILTRRYFAMVQIDTDAGSANGYWNGDAGGSHAHSPLGTLARQGACWVNREAKVCAWRPGTRQAYDR